LVSLHITKLNILNEFTIWFITGYEHIADWNAYDHILFLLVLCGVYNLKDWKTILILVSAFTIGHSITLAMSVLNIFVANAAWIEFLIPVSILITAILNLSSLDKNKNVSIKINYFLALFFGFIHGMGFSYLLKSLLGREESITYPLFAFNVGLEFGQITIVLIVLLISTIVNRISNITERDKNFFISSAVFGIAFIMALERVGAIF
jgi:hypothetical protein